MPDPASPPAAPAPLRTCENCRAALQGGYCHLCGQPEQSPVRHLGHATEEVFESFWHLDGRIFRTLRELWIPGRVACEYLSGHRVRYVAPLRLFVILTALTFFVAQFLVGPDGARMESLDAGGDVGEAITSMHEADSVAEVERIRDEVVADLSQARAQIPAYLPSLDAGIVSAQSAARRAADARIGELRAAGADDAGESESGAATDAGPDGEPAAPEPAGPDPGAPDATALETSGTGSPATADPADWGHPESLERINRNAQRLAEEPRAFFRALLGSAPMALFITVPLFAVMLKLAYLFRRRLYLEHVVVALYSHAWLMVVLLLYFLSVLAAGWLEPLAAWTATPLWWLQTLLLWAMPLYLLWMQKRVYRQSWTMTVLKYFMIGIAYVTLVTTVAVAVSIYVLFTM
ncbi:MAG: DUF3667 domain-containing protein [Luteimonas sp.]